MKTLIFVLLLWSTGFTAPKCFGDYTPLVSRVEKTYIRAQANFERVYPGDYIYKFFPVSMFPLFCAMDKPNFSKYRLKYLCSHEVNIYVREDSMNYYVVFAVLQYVKTDQSIPSMTYSMYFFTKNKHATEWLEEKKPLVVVFTWSPARNQYISR